MENNNPAPNIESRETEVNGRRIHYLTAGQGKPVVLIHGGASSAQEWRRTMAACGDRFCFYAPDLPGFGESARDPKGYYLNDFPDFLLGFIELLKLERPALAGHSLGARICLDAAGRPGNNISQLVLIDGSGLGKMTPFGLALFNFFKWLRNVQKKPQPFPTFLAREGDNWDDVGDETLKNIKVPTLLVWKGFDPYIPLAYARRAAGLIPQARLEVFPGYGHAPHQQKDNRPFNRLLRDFLENGAV